VCFYECEKEYLFNKSHNYFYICCIDYLDKEMIKNK